MPSPNTPAPLLSSPPQNSPSLSTNLLSSPSLSYHSPLKHCQDTNWGRSKVAVPEGEVDWSRNSAAEGDATSSSSSSSSARVTNERRDRDTRDRSPDSRERRDRDFGGGGERTHRDDRREDRGQRGGRGGKGGKGYRNPRDPRIDTAPPLSECKPIEHIANRWKPAYKNDGGAAGLDTLTQDEKLKRVHGILNKFTPEKFVRLSDQIVEMVTTQEALDDIIGCIVEKACHEQFFSELYAEMCVKLSQVPLPVALEDKAALFRRLLLNKCGTVFGEQSVAHAAAAAALPAAAAVAAAAPDDEPVVVAEAKGADGEEGGEEGGEDADEAPAVTESAEKKALRAATAAAKAAKKAFLGQIRFVGELYVKALVPNKVMHQTIIRLFGAEREGGLELGMDDDEVECLCSLFTTIGRRFDSRSALAVYESPGALAEGRAAGGAAGGKAAKSKDKKKRKGGKRVRTVTNAKYVNKYFAALTALGEQERLASRTRYGIQDLVELRSRDWKPRRKVEVAKRLGELEAESLKKAGRMKEAARAMEEANADDGGWSTVTVGAKAGVVEEERAAGIGGGAGLFGMLGGGKNTGKDASRRRKKEEADVLKQAKKEEKRRRKALKLKEAEEKAAEMGIVSSGVTEDAAIRSIRGTVKEYFSLRSMPEALASVEELAAPEHLHMFVQHGVASALELGGSGAHWEALGELLSGLMCEDPPLLMSEEVTEELSKAVSRLTDLIGAIPGADVSVGALIGVMMAKVRALGDEWDLEWVLWALDNATNAGDASFKFNFLANVVAAAKDATVRVVWRGGAGRWWMVYGVWCKWGWCGKRLGGREGE